MKICIIIIIEKKFSLENIKLFFDTMAKTENEYSVIVINNTGEKIEKIINDKISNIKIISNNVDVGRIVSFNQGLQYSKNNFDYSIFINPMYSIVLDGDWISSIKKCIDDKFGIGGTVNYLKISKSEKIRKLLYSCSQKGDLSWLAENINKYMLVEYVDRNIFVVKNSIVNFIDSRFCDEDSISMQLSFQVLANKGNIVNIREIYSSSDDFYRFDIINKINDGIKIICPVKISSVREKFVI